LIGGADFGELAREHSQDPGSAPNGGDMGWFRRGATIREFENVAFALPDGGISTPTRTELGWHIIMKERRRGQSEVKARHILIMPEMTDTDLDRARETAREVGTRAREGGDMEALFEEFGDPGQPFAFTESRENVVQISFPGYAENLGTAAEGDIIGPFETRLRSGTIYLVVVKITEVRDAGEFTFEDVREEIRLYLTRQKRFERVIEALRDRTYIDLRM
ncbi:MAG TPA: peptidylprolyl isomerase, partial [Longimicrobiales bacterium]